MLRILLTFICVATCLFVSARERTTTRSPNTTVDEASLDADCSFTLDVSNPCTREGLGSVTVSTDGEAIRYRLLDLIGRELRSNTTGTFDSLERETYQLAVDFTGDCSSTQVFSVSRRGSSARFTTSGDLCIEPSTYTLTLEQTGEVPPGFEIVSYQWENGATTPSITITENSRNYLVNVTYANGCTGGFNKFVDVAVDGIDWPATTETDCITGDVTIALPPELRGRNNTWTYKGPEDFRLENVDSVTLSTSGPLTVKVDGGRCKIGGTTQVMNGSYDGIGIQSLGDCDPAFSLQLTDTIETIDYPLGAGDGDVAFSVEWRGPELAVEGGPVLILFPPENQPGIFTASMRSYCGDTTLSFLITESGDTTQTCGPIAPVAPGATSNLSGTVDAAQSSDCTVPGSTNPVVGTLVRVRETTDPENVYFLFTDASGRFERLVRPGTYEITALPNQASFLESCQSATVTVSASGPAVSANVTVIPVKDCPVLQTSVISPRFQPCFKTQTYVSYQSLSPVITDNATLTVRVDSFFTDLTADAPYNRTGSTLVFDLGELEAFERGRIRINYTLSCEAPLGALHCVEASITSPDVCNPAGDFALVTVDPVGCSGDSLSFRVTNAGSVVMRTDLEYFVYRDGQLVQELSARRPPLQAGESVVATLPADGTTVSLTAKQDDQSRGAAYPTATIQSCGGFTPGFVTSGSGGAPGTDRYCRTNADSFAPNEKRVYPSTGNGLDNVILPGTRLVYDLNFQNTGTGTVSTVVIRDTLPAELDITTIEFGASSHAYVPTIDSNRTLTFTFDNIDLVDSSTSVSGSMGVVTFSVDHVADLVRGDRFQTRAGIFFDNKEAAVTEYTRTEIASLPLISSVRAGANAVIPSINLYPNPVGDLLQYALPAEIKFEKADLRIQDALGRSVITGELFGRTGTIDVGALPMGSYQFVLTYRGRLVGRSRFVVAR